jgi:hypothetical protein
VSGRGCADAVCVTLKGANSRGCISVAKEVFAERFGPNKKVQKDMLGSFIANGLTQEEAGSESLLQMSVSLSLTFIVTANARHSDSLAPTQPQQPSVPLSSI